MARRALREPTDARHSRSDRGAGIVLLLAMVAVVSGLTGVAIGLVQISFDRSHGATAADLSALGAAEQVAFGDPCGAARRVAQLNRARLEACEVAGLDVTVRVSVSMSPFVRRIAVMAAADAPRVRALARAGPGSHANAG